MRKWMKKTVQVLVALILAFFASLGWVYSRLPDTFYVPEGKILYLAQMPWVTGLEHTGTRSVQAQKAGASSNITLSIFGVVPVKTVRMVSVNSQTVTVCGTPFGIKMFSDGALIVGFSDVATAEGYCNPAKDAGLQMGDLIISLNGKRVVTNEQVSAEIRAARENKIFVRFEREDAVKTTELQPACDETGEYRAGMWVRDSSAGIGTLTFVQNENGVFAGLGHAISDADTGTNIELLSGEIQAVTVTGYSKGTVGTPGELKGEFATGEDVLGKVLFNQTTGIYGTVMFPLPGRSFRVAQAQEVVTGPAQILTTINGTTPQLYDVKVEHISFTAGDPNRNMVLHVVDENLLNTTGGIVQGMSGSPILQNGKLIGAVTHVLVNDPTRGYGIFAQTMLEQTNKVVKTQTTAIG